MRLRLLNPVKFQGQRLAPGEELDLDEDGASELLACGAAEPADGKPAKLPPASTPKAAGAAPKPKPAPRTSGANKVAAKNAGPKKKS